MNRSLDGGKAQPAPGRSLPSPVAALVPPLFLAPFLLCTGCDLPNYPGPQIQEPPAGFHIQPEASLGREMFPDREHTFRTAWVNTSWGQTSTIHISGYPGTIMRADVNDAQAAAQAAATGSVTFGAVREVNIDGRRAWGWHERSETPTTGTEWVAYRVVVPYDTISYAVELYSADPAFKDLPDTLAAIAATFAVGETTWNVPLLLAVALLAVIALRAAKKRADDRAQRMQNVHFVKVPGKDEDGGGGAGEGPGSEAGGGGRGPSPPGSGD